MKNVPVTLTQLLRDPLYKQYFCRAPRLPRGTTNGLPWQVWATVDGRWATKRFCTYVDAFAMVKAKLKCYDDITITCRPLFWAPPEGFVIPSGHVWCGRCRRPAIFGYHRRHHALEGYDRYCSESVRRCVFCGVREMSLRTVPHH